MELMQVLPIILKKNKEERIIKCGNYFDCFFITLVIKKQYISLYRNYLYDILIINY